jgi:hypothetical protein
MREGHVPGDSGSSCRAATCSRTEESDSKVSAASACVGLKSFIVRATCGCALIGRRDGLSHSPQLREKMGKVRANTLDWTRRRVKERRVR